MKADLSLRSLKYLISCVYRDLAQIECEIDSDCFDKPYTYEAFKYRLDMLTATGSDLYDAVYTLFEADYDVMDSCGIPDRGHFYSRIEQLKTWLESLRVEIQCPIEDTPTRGGISSGTRGE